VGGNKKKNNDKGETTKGQLNVKDKTRPGKQGVQATILPRRGEAAPQLSVRGRNVADQRGTQAVGAQEK